jgi:hypothetical protein
MGNRLWSTIIKYTINVRLHSSIEAELNEITEAAFRSVVLIDDFFGHHRDHFKARSSPVNAVTVMKINSPGMPDSNVMDAVGNRAKYEEGQFRNMRDAWMNKEKQKYDQVAIDGRAYLIALSDFVAGYHAWAGSCPRYLQYRPQQVQ